MSTWAVLPLSEESWAPQRLLPAPRPCAAPAGYDDGLVPLAELVEFFPATHVLRPGEAVVTPGGVSRETGAVHPTAGSVEGTGYRLGDGLQEGDVLVPLSGRGPSVLVDQSHAQLAFSRDFTALRPTDSLHALRLWALLGSTSGIDAKLRLSIGAAVARVSPSDLAGLLVPHPPPARWNNLEPLLPRPAVDDTTTAPVLSRWRSISLHDQASWATRKFLDPVEGEGWVTLEELGEIRSGHLDAKDFNENPSARAVPAMRPRDVGRLSTARYWAQADDPDVTGPASLLVAAMSLRIATPPEGVAVGREILVFDAKETDTLSAVAVRDRLAAYLASKAGQNRLMQHTAGVTVQRLSKTALSEFRVPRPEDLPDDDPPVEALLETRLEKALWS